MQTIQFKIARTVRCKVVVNGAKVRTKLASQGLGTIAVKLGDKVVRLWEVAIKKGERLEVTKLI